MHGWVCSNDIQEFAKVDMVIWECCSSLLDDRGEGIGDDCDGDEEGDQQDDACREDLLDILEKFE